MAYDVDFRKRVISFVQDEGHTRKEACKLFNISVNTLYLWEQQLKHQGTLTVKKRSPRPRKLPLDQLQKFVSEHPDAFLREIAEHFDCTPQSVWAALKKINVTLKKDYHL
ncbi:TPA: IS630 transposase-related protein [Streptococcus pyogenes]|uniref:IS630 transposase-related protein n=1 Tax=Streptococcus pyogenes TaxID=1314 RepID=UPI0003585997|nr:IS630 transposase-related protein [Streptococcus pyogenes]ESU88054.1 transposase [Streptococcus pyogenes GA03799]HER4616693.1 helix-turn-helix domain-containing protein [Streptococcus pyogenes NGAS535]HER4668220.1 helix-turn-helix domain-containing protein [Streptococcus pyogenes NGAS401]HER4761368.1 helix-turn-helix domain-containing protein [Streptococcus pyogenes NGAS227]HER4796339.1 helix-turn-helix domain-containing protein [Streptococcus pyogenes NGAS128]